MFSSISGYTNSGYTNADARMQKSDIGKTPGTAMASIDGINNSANGAHCAG